MVVDIFNVYIYNEKLKLFSAMPLLYKNINIDDLSYQLNSLADSNTEIETVNVIIVSTPPPFWMQRNIF